LFEDLSTAIIYTAYMSPNDRFQTVQELAFSFGYNDSKLLGPFALNPNALLAFEVKGQANAGAHKGVCLQLGIAPGLTLFDKTEYPIAVSVPINFGISLSDYYEFGTGNDDGFGWWSVGPGRGHAFEVHSAAIWRLAGQGFGEHAPYRR